MCSLICGSKIIRQKDRPKLLTVSRPSENHPRLHLLSVVPYNFGYPRKDAFKVVFTSFRCFVIFLQRSLNRVSSGNCMYKEADNLLRKKES